MAPRQLPLPGEVFAVEGRTAFLISPARHAPGRPWVWYAPTLPAYPAAEEEWMFRRFLEAGLAVAGIDVGESYGNPEGCRLFSALHGELAGGRGLSARPCLLARSRGGLMLYNWAVEHADSVACVAGIYPVCDLASYPGLSVAAPAYGLPEADFAGQLPRLNPVDRLAPLSGARVPVFHIHGDCDEIVPLERNSAELERRYRAMGGPVTLRVVKGQGHNLWSGWFRCHELVDFVVAHSADAGGIQR